VVGAQELDELIVLALAAVILDGHVGGVHLGDHAVALGQHHHLGIQADLVLHTGAHDGSLRPQQGHGLPLHVGAHQGAVGVVVGQEGDHGRGDGHHHTGGDVHIVHVFRLHLDGLVLVAAGDTGADEAAVLVHRLRRLTHNVLILHVSGHIGDLVGDMAGGPVHPAEGGLDEAVFIDPGIGGQIGDQADVGTFGGLDGAHTAIVAVVHVADLHVGALAAEAAGAQGGQTPLVGQLGQGVGLVHELAQGAGAEELLDGCGNGPDVDQALGRDNVQILDGHPLPDDPLHAGKADAELVLQQLTHAAQAAVAQMVDIVLLHQAVGQDVHIVDGGEDVVDDDVLGHQAVRLQAALLDKLLALILTQQLLQHVEAHPLLDAAGRLGIKVHIAAHVAHAVGENADDVAVFQLDLHHTHADGVQGAAVVAGEDMALLQQQLAGGGVGYGLGQLLALGLGPQGQLLVELIPAHGAQVIPPGIEEQVLHQGLGGVQRGRLAGALLAIDLQHGLLIGFAGVLFHGGHNAGIVAEAVQDIGVGFQAQGPDQAGDGQLAVLVDADPKHLAAVGLILQPGAAVGDHRGRQQGQVRFQVDLLAVVDAGGADDLADHHALGAVDDEGAAMGHQGEIAHEDLLLLDFARLLIVQADADLHGGGIGGIPGLALLHVVLGLFVHAVVDEAQLQVAGIVADGGHVGKNLPQAGVQEPLIGFLLDLQQVGHRHDLFVSGKVLAQGLAIILVLGHLQYSRLSFRIFSVLFLRERLSTDLTRGGELFVFALFHL